MQENNPITNKNNEQSYFQSVQPIIEALDKNPIKKDLIINTKLSEITIDHEMTKQFSVEEIESWLIRTLVGVLNPFNLGIESFKNNRDDQFKISELEISIRYAIIAIRIYFKDDRQFVAVFDNKHIHPHIIEKMLPLLRVSIGLMHRIASYNYLEEALEGAKVLKKMLERLQSIDEMKLEKKFKNIARYINEEYLGILKLISFCYIQTKNPVVAGVASAEAMHAAQKIYSGSLHDNRLKYEIFHKSILCIYHIEESDLYQARAVLNLALDLYFKNIKKNSSILIFHVDILICAVEKLATHLFLSKNFTEALEYFKTQDQLIAYLISNINELPHPGLKKPFDKNTRLFLYTRESMEKTRMSLYSKIKNIDSKIFNENVDILKHVLSSKKINNYLESNNPYTIDSESKIVSINLKDEKIAITLEVELYKVQIKVKRLAKNLTISISNSVDLRRIGKIIYNVSLALRIEQPRDEKTLILQRNQTKDNNREPETSLVSTYVLLANSSELYKKSHVEIKKKAKEFELKENKTIEIRTSPQTSTPSKICWPGMKVEYDSVAKNQIVYSLSNPPFIPEGHWYAYLDELKLQHELDEKKLQLIRNVLIRGLLSNKGQAVKPAKDELAKTIYGFKIRLLGAEGKGDIRVYGRYVESVTDDEGKMRKLIVFDYVLLHAHKKNHLPKADKETNSNNSDISTSSFP